MHTLYNLIYIHIYKSSHLVSDISNSPYILWNFVFSLSPDSNGSALPESPENTPIKTAAPEVESFSPEPQMEMEDPSLNLQQPVRAPTPPPEENHQVLEQVEVEKPPVEEPVDNSKHKIKTLIYCKGLKEQNIGTSS